MMQSDLALLRERQCEAYQVIPDHLTPWYIDTHLAGYVSPAIREVLLDLLPNLHRLADRLVWSPCVDVNQALADVAEVLFRQGIIKHWRNELIDVWSDSGDVLAQVERALVRSLGLKTRAIHLNAYNPQQHIWVAQRAANKAVDPNRWDTLVGGMVGAGETLQYALIRESDEEAGLPAQLVQQAIEHASYEIQRVVPEGLMREYAAIYTLTLPETIIPKNQDGEVQSIRCLARGEVVHMISERAFTLDASLAILLSMMDPV